MHKLYQRSPIWFSIIWIVIYVLGASITDAVSESVGIPKLWTVIYLILLSLIAVLFLNKYDLYQKYGLCAPKISAKKTLYYIPLLIVTLCNLWFGVQINFPALQTLLYVISMALVGFLEEMIFRGFLYQAMHKESPLSAIIVSSVTFGIGHIVNLFNASGADLVSTLCQISSAISFGFLFVVIFERTQSLYPCILCHALLNASSAFGNTAANERYVIPVSIVLIMITSLYALFLNNKKRL